MPLLCLFLMGTWFRRGVGDAVTLAWTLALSAGLGLRITPLLITGSLGLPPMGVASAAIHLGAVLVPGLQPVFKTFDMSQREWTTLLLLSAAIIPLMEDAKIGYRAMRPHRAGDGPASSTRSGAVPTDRQSGKGSSA